MSLSYIRKNYGVPAKKNAPVAVNTGLYTGRTGFVTGSSGSLLTIILVGEKEPKIFHPTDVDWVDESLLGNFMSELSNEIGGLDLSEHMAISILADKLRESDATFNDILAISALLVKALNERMDDGK